MRHRFATAMVVIFGLLSFGAAAAAAEDATEMAREALDAFIGAVASGDVEVIGAVLAPEYQIMRASGVGYDRATYLESDMPSIEGSEWRVEEPVATISDDLLVVRYHLTIDEVIEGKQVARRAPRLTVFRRHGDRWLVVAHANFAATQ